MKELGEVITAMVTPFNDKLEVDYGKARDLAVRLAEEGSDGLVVCGTTGESPTLTTEEKVKLFSSVREAVEDRASVIAGVGSYNTAETILLAKKAEEAGVDGLLVVVPYYNKPPQEGLYYHFQLVAENTSLPIMLYNIPGRTGVNMTPETVGRLAQVKNIVGIKEASGNLEQVSEILRLTWMYWSAEPKAVTEAVRKYYPDPAQESKRAPEGNMFEVWSGDDSLTLPMLAIGAKGVVSVASHLVGPWIKTMIRSFQMGEVDKARGIHLRILPLLKALFMTTNPIPVKAAMRMTGFDVGKVRPPLVDLTPAEEEKLRKVLDGLATSIKMGKELALGKTR